MSLTIYAHPWSINSRKVLMTVAEKKAPFTLELIVLPRGEHKQPAHLARHPFGKVPVIDHDGFALYETRAIQRYLDATLEGVGLVPEDRREQARMEQWLGVAESYFSPLVHPMLVELVFRRHLGGERNEAAISAGRAGMAPVLDVLDRELREAPYLAGERFSLADIHYMPYFEYLERTGEGALASRDGLSGWWRRVSARPTWRDVARTGQQPDEPR